MGQATARRMDPGSLAGMTINFSAFVDHPDGFTF